MITIKEAWQYGRAQLRHSPSPSLDARLLLEHVLEREHAYLLAHDNHSLTAGQLEAYRSLIQRAAGQEPIPYLTGRAPFFGLEFVVSPAVLIPRPETEQLVEQAIQWSRAQPRLRVADIGTGSGCIAVSLAIHLPEAEIIAVDISEPALGIARQNVARLAPGRACLIRAHLMSPLTAGIDLIVANLPYIAGHEWPGLPDGVKSFEPVLALRGGSDGLDLIRTFLLQAAERLRPGGMVIFEIGWQQGAAAETLARDAFPEARVDVWPDFAGLDRLVTVKTEL